MNTVKLTLNRDKLVTINTGLVLYNRELKGITNHAELKHYRSKIGKAKYIVNEAFKELEKQEVIK